MAMPLPQHNTAGQRKGPWIPRIPSYASMIAPSRRWSLSIGYPWLGIPGIQGISYPIANTGTFSGTTVVPTSQYAA
jgi:hypothetical protein